MPALYERLGGREAIAALVPVFYDHVLADDRVARFFEGVDMKQQMAKQTGFLTMALGGPNGYTGKRLEEGHAHLLEQGLADEHVDAIAEILGRTLSDAGVGEEDVREVLTVVEGTRDAVLGRTGSTVAGA